MKTPYHLHPDGELVATLEGSDFGLHTAKFSIVADALRRSPARQGRHVIDDPRQARLDCIAAQPCPVERARQHIAGCRRVGRDRAAFDHVGRHVLEVGL